MTNNDAPDVLPPLTAYAAMTLAELLHTGSVAADLRARDVITQADFLHRSDIVIAALMVVRLDAELKVARERLAALLPAPSAAGAAEPGNAATVVLPMKWWHLPELGPLMGVDTEGQRDNSYGPFDTREEAQADWLKAISSPPPGENEAKP